MNILVIGGGGREHSLVWKLQQNAQSRLFALPGNPGIGAHATLCPEQDPLDLAIANQVDLTIVGPEAPLVAGLADRFRAAGHRILGPSAAAARIEGSKIFAKELMDEAGIPTARFQVFDDPVAAERALCRFEYPVVLKADGLASGKGVVIAKNRREAEAALRQMLSGEMVGEAGKRVVIEDFCPGEEVSLIAIADGETAATLAPVQDHKAVYDQDRGPNTGGMGTYSDDRILPPAVQEELKRQVIDPVIAAMARRGTPFQGFLFAGLMLTPSGPKVLEYNVRLGDPESQVLLYRLETDLAELADAATSNRLRDVRLRWKPDPAVCVVLCAANYPGPPRRGDEIGGLDHAAAMGATVFHAGTALDGGRLVTSGGRVLGVTATASTLPEAIRRTYEAVSRIQFAGMHYRRDIGAKGLKRW